MPKQNKFIGNNQSSNLSEEDRFWEKADKKGEDECWEWLAGKNYKGYGVFRFDDNGKLGYIAHRASWKIHFGCRPKHLLVLHHCDNPSCVNPNHLFLGTNQDNMNDMSNKKRSTWGEKSWTSKLTSLDVRKIRNEPERWGVITHLAKEFNVATSTISQIRKNITWKQLDD